MPTITVELSDEQLARFAGSARLLGVTPEELASRSLRDLLEHQGERLDRVIRDIVAERAEVLRRLAP